MNQNLSPTSALVLLWSGHKLYKTPAAQAYWKRLNLTAGNWISMGCGRSWKLFATSTGSNRCIFEYMVPSHDVVLGRRNIPAGVFGEIAVQCRCAPVMTTWRRVDWSCEPVPYCIAARHPTEYGVGSDWAQRTLHNPGQRVDRDCGTGSVMQACPFLCTPYTPAHARG